jgi:DNA mismatch repair protein MutS2
MIYPQNFESKIGFDTVRKEIAKRCISPLGETHCDTMRFSSSYEDVTLWLNQTNEFLSILQTKKEFPLNYFFDLRPALKTITAPGTYISAENLFNLQRSLNTIAEIIKFFEVDEDEANPYPNLTKLISSLGCFPEIVNATTKILDKFGNIKDNASPHLQELRTSIVQLTSSINGILRRVISEGRQNGVLEKDTMPSMRDGRLVIPVSPMNKRKVKGIVHDESASGKTIFIEPEEVVEANNRIRETEAEITREIIKILAEVTDIIRPHIEELQGSYDILGVIDFIRAKATLAADIDAQMPHIEKKPTVEWYHAVHPALFMALKEQGKEVVPLNIELNNKNRILIISGPNAGGKSVCLKTVGVVQYMTQCGILPPVYNNSHIGLFKSIFIDIGDQQSIEDDLSTYSSHLSNMKYYLNHGGGETLILIDEFGSGTEPQIGGAIAQSILEQLNEKKVYGVITTHYQNLKHFAEDTDGIVNGAMLYDRQRMQPLFQLSIGYPGSSFAIEIARKIGLPQEVIGKASEIVGSDYINMDKYLLDIVRDRKYWENKRNEIHIKEKRLNEAIEKYDRQFESITQEHKDIIKEAKIEAKEILSQSNAQIERTIREIKETQAEKERTKAARQKLNEFKQKIEDEQIEQPEPLKALKPKRQPQPKQKAKTAVKVDKRPLKVNDNVVMKGATSVGKVISIDEKYAIVAFGNIKTRVESSMLERTNKTVEKAKDTSFVSTSTKNDIRDKQLNFKPDIDVRGMRADEAIQAVTYFIDDAIQFNSKRVRILHGTGTGILRERIREYLNTVANIRSYRDEHVQLGGAGITVVDLE